MTRASSARADARHAVHRETVTSAPLLLSVGFWAGQMSGQRLAGAHQADFVGASLDLKRSRLR